MWKNPKILLVHHHYTHESIAITGWSIPHFSPPLLAPDSQPKSWQDKYGFEDMVPLKLIRPSQSNGPFSVFFSTISRHLSPGNAILRKQLPSTSKATAVWMAKFTNRTPHTARHWDHIIVQRTGTQPMKLQQLLGNYVETNFDHTWRWYIRWYHIPKCAEISCCCFHEPQLVVRFSNFLVKSYNNPPKMGG